MSTTPRVDALLLEINEGRVYETYGPLADLARQLERELNAALSALLKTTITAQLHDKVTGGLPPETRWLAGG